MNQIAQKQTFQIQHNMAKNLDWQAADQLAIYKRGPARSCTRDY